MPAVPVPAKRHVCAVCQRSFHQQPSLAAHMRVHKLAPAAPAPAAPAAPPKSERMGREESRGRLVDLNRALLAIQAACGGHRGARPGAAGAAARRSRRDPAEARRSLSRNLERLERLAALYCEVRSS